MENILSPQKLVEEVKNEFDIFQNNDLFDDSFCFSDNSEATVALIMALSFKENLLLSNYSFDIEYNHIAKNLFHPILIAHLPKTQLANLLVIEFAKGESTDEKQSKLSEMTDRNSKYHYRLGILINFSKEYKISDWKYFVDGRSMSEKDAIKTLEKYNILANDSFYTKFQKLADVYWLGKEHIDEDKDQRRLAQSLQDNYQWDMADNQLESDYTIMTLSLLNELRYFGDEIKKYLNHIYVPSYDRVSEMIVFLYQNILPEIKGHPDIDNIGWLSQWEYALPTISKLLMYCHYSLIENNPHEASLLLSDLIEISKQSTNENVLNLLENCLLQN